MHPRRFEPAALSTWYTSYLSIVINPAVTPTLTNLYIHCSIVKCKTGLRQEHILQNKRQQQYNEILLVAIFPRFVCFFVRLAHSQNSEKWLLASPYLSVCVSAWNNSGVAGRIFIKLNIWGFFENLSREFKFDYNMTKNNSKTDVNLWYLAQFCVEREMFQTKVVEKIKTHILCSVTPSKIMAFTRWCIKI
jgi:hypothetical protein